MANFLPEEQTAKWYQFRLRELLLAALLIGLVGAVWHQARQVSHLAEEMDRFRRGHPFSGELLRYSGIAAGSVVRRDAEGKPAYVNAHGSKVEVYETFVLVYLLDRNSPEMPVQSVQFIPRDQLIDVSFQPPKL